MLRRYKRRYPLKRRYGRYGRYKKRRVTTRYRRTKKRYSRRSKAFRRTTRGANIKSKCTGTGNVDPIPQPITGLTTINDVNVLDEFGDNNIKLWLGQMHAQMLPYPTSLNSTNISTDRRLSNSVLIKGFKINRTFSMDLTPVYDSTGPVIVHYCLMQPKSPYTNFMFTGVLNPVLTERMFRDYSDIDDESKNFEGNTITTKSWKYDRVHGVLNKDHGFRTITHKKKVLWNTRGRLEPGAGASQLNRLSYMWHMNTYVKYGKWVNYSEATSNIPDEPIFEVMWYETVDNQKYGSVGASASNFLSTTRRAWCYFDDVK